jgi:hypothetical protein
MIWAQTHGLRTENTPNQAATEGRKRAQANGVKFGPKFKLNHFQRQKALARTGTMDRPGTFFIYC